MRSIIVAYDRERAIGSNGDLLWKKGELASDMDHFRSETMGSILIMGRKTLESIGICLPGRKTIVLTRSESCSVEGAQIAHSLDEAYDLADDIERSRIDPNTSENDKYHGIFVVGGGEIYKQALDDVDRVYATEVDAIIPGADTHFPTLDDNWEKIAEKKYEADNRNRYPYSFVTYERFL